MTTCAFIKLYEVNRLGLSSKINLVWYQHSWTPALSNIIIITYIFLYQCWLLPFLIVLFYKICCHRITFSIWFQPIIKSSPYQQCSINNGKPIYEVCYWVFYIFQYSVNFPYKNAKRVLSLERSLSHQRLQLQSSRVPDLYNRLRCFTWILWCIRNCLSLIITDI